MSRHSLSISISVLLIVILSGCHERSTDLCDQRIINKCLSCSPYMERLRIVTNELDETKVTEVKHCGDLAALLTVKDKKLADATLKGCISESIVLDKETKERLFAELDRAQVPQAEYDAWLRCYEKIVTPKPVVVVMDSHLKDVVYCKHTREICGSNAVDIVELIDDLPVTPIPLSTHLEWQSDQQVISLEPKMLIIHASAFYEKTQAMEGNKRLVDFVNSLKGTGIKILVYTRGLPDQAPEDVRERWIKVRGLESNRNVKLFIMPKGKDKDSCFTDPDVGRPFKNAVKEMLGF